MKIGHICDGWWKNDARRIFLDKMRFRSCPLMCVNFLDILIVFVYFLGNFRARNVTNMIMLVLMVDFHSMYCTPIWPISFMWLFPDVERIFRLFLLIFGKKLDKNWTFSGFRIGFVWYVSQLPARRGSLPHQKGATS